jgi:hypothetical protein
MDAELPEISQDDMLLIRARVQRRILASFHEHRLLARTLRKAGKRQLAAQEDREAATYLGMLRSIADPSDVTTPPDITHLLEELDS